eukprot:gnl/Hemi2/5551_TR1910_c0_g1_i1.p1 gnl/Hemi2/5551_TR1910_c0_g1~~gnl/Hemi2/5551_TR1910_c0_g1_i1.p1  ORF type:complete len:274 (-),score=60.58 gnl/Hemi2/5551_TR1910_c0_g1_i1:202-1023(-)
MAADGSTLGVFQNQVAGHKAQGGKRGFLQRDGKIYKLLQDDGRGQQEVEFYMNQLSPDDEMYEKNIISRAFGLAQAMDPTANEMGSYLVLEDLTAGYQHPSMLDIKIGTRTCDEVREAQKPSARDRDLTSTSWEIGYRVCGFKVWRTDSNSLKTYGRDYVRSLTTQTMKDRMIREFFLHTDTELRWDVLPLVRAEVSRILDWLKAQTRFRFFASSLFIIYEGDLSCAPRVTVRLIDFAHWRSAADYNNEPDSGNITGVTNFLHGLDAVIARTP